MNLRSNASVTPILRLVGGGAPAIGVRAGEIDRDEVTRQIIREDRAASLQQDLDPADPRWVLAARTRGELQGAALTADRRTRLLSLAHQLHMRPFDANMIIAIVQDEARLASAGSDSTWELVERLRIIPNRDDRRLGKARPVPPPPTIRARRGVPASLLVLLSVLLGLGGLAAVLNWLMAG